MRFSCRRSWSLTLPSLFCPTFLWADAKAWVPLWWCWQEVQSLGPPACLWEPSAQPTPGLWDLWEGWVHHLLPQPPQATLRQTWVSHALSPESLIAWLVSLAYPIGVCACAHVCLCVRKASSVSISKPNFRNVGGGMSILFLAVGWPQHQPRQMSLIFIYWPCIWWPH